MLVGSIIPLSGRSIYPGQLEMAGKFLMHFVEMFDVYYGKQCDISERSFELHFNSSSSLLHCLNFQSKKMCFMMIKGRCMVAH